MENIITYLEKNAIKFKNKNAFIDNNGSLTYEELFNNAKKVANGLSNYQNMPIAIYMEKSKELITVILGVIMSGNFYTVIDPKMPKERVNIILNILEPQVIIGNDIKEIYTNAKKINYQELLKNKKDLIKKQDLILTNPMYILFTSGSTGIPKGVVISHNAFNHYIDWFTKCFNINSKTIFGSQTPLYFSMSVSDVFSTIKKGATMYLIPKMYFSFPQKLIDYLNDTKINTIYWVPSALAIPYNYDALKYNKLPYLKNILFAGEVMPPKVLKYYQDHLQYTKFANLFGPTETTDICTYYKIKNKIDINKSIPIGIPCEGLEAIIKDQELYIKGPFLASGYYKEPNKTQEAFVQNPLHDKYPDIVYKTGDLVNKDENNILNYESRKDFQIKRQGYRIELSEIEANAENIDGILSCVCTYLSPQIILFYVGNITEIELMKALNFKLPRYMLPNKIVKIIKMVYNMNGKVDRTYYNNYAKEEMK